MSDGARTRDIPDHNRVLYQLSYAHHVYCLANDTAKLLNFFQPLFTHILLGNKDCAAVVIKLCNGIPDIT